MDGTTRDIASHAGTELRRLTSDCGAGRRPKPAQLRGEGNRRRMARPP